MIGDMLYRRFQAGQEKSVPEAQTSVGASGEGEAYDMSQARADDIGHKRMDVSDEVEQEELDELIEEPMDDNAMEHIRVNDGRTHVKVLFCTS